MCKNGGERLLQKHYNYVKKFRHL